MVRDAAVTPGIFLPPTALYAARRLSAAREQQRPVRPERRLPLILSSIRVARCCHHGTRPRRLPPAAAVQPHAPARPLRPPPPRPVVQLQCDPLLLARHHPWRAVRGAARHLRRVARARRDGPRRRARVARRAEFARRQTPSRLTRDRRRSRSAGPGSSYWSSACTPFG